MQILSGLPATDVFNILLLGCANDLEYDIQLVGVQFYNWCHKKKTVRVMYVSQNTSAFFPAATAHVEMDLKRFVAARSCAK